MDRHAGDGAEQGESSDAAEAGFEPGGVTRLLTLDTDRRAAKDGDDQARDGGEAKVHPLKIPPLPDDSARSLYTCGKFIYTLWP